MLGFKSHARNVKISDVKDVLKKEKIGFKDYITLLSEPAAELIDDIALKSRHITNKYFGKTILLYAPLYVSNECENACVYCGFREDIPERRKTLSLDEVLKEADFLYRKGFRHILLVSGEKTDKVSVKYLEETICGLHKNFDSISLEIYPLETRDYSKLISAGADGLTIYQESYGRETYKKLHPCGPKSDYEFRLAAPERAALAGFRRVNIGALLGLDEWFDEVLALGLHAAYLIKTFWKTQIAVSFPRVRASAARYSAPRPVSDIKLVRMICALRLFLPTVALVLSTRENEALRDNLIPLGITQMSAESKTSPGGYSASASEISAIAAAQFEVEDKRTLAEVMEAISKKGYDPVLKDWDKTYL